jgi:tetratricopeptide (TPR) repeat protein
MHAFFPDGSPPFTDSVLVQIKERKGTGDRIKEDTKPTVEQFLEIEQWAMKELEVTEPDSLWMVQTAITLRHFGHYDLSRERSLKSQEMDPKNWRAPFCLAQISALQGKYEEALTLLDKVIEMFRADNTLLEVWRDTYYDSIIYFQGDWNVEVKQFDKAIASYRQVHSGIPDAYNPILRIMEIFQSQEKYGEIMDCLEAMGSEMNEKGLSHLVAMSFEFAGTTAYHQIIAEAGRKTSREEVVQRVYEDSLEAAKADDMKLLVMTSLRLWYAFHLYYDRKGEGDREKAIQILEENLCVTYKGYQPGIAETKYTTAKRLATLYFHEARNAGAGTERGKDYHDRLVLLSNGKNIRGNDIDTKVDAKLLLARLYFSRGEKELAKSTMRYHIRLGMDLLSDSDESNDWQGYMQLAVALVHADDDADALAAWSLLGPIPDDVTEEKDGEESTEEKEEGESGSQPDEGITETAEVSTAGEDEESAPEDTEVLTPGSPDEPAKAENATEKDGAEVPADEKQEDGNDSAESTTSAVTPKLRSGHLGNICDGECGQGWGYADDIYFCRDCLDVQFGTYCYEKLKGGTLPLRICGQAHEFFHVPPWNDELMAQVPKGSVRVGEEIITIEEWLGRLKEKWGI